MGGVVILIIHPMPILQLQEKIFYVSIKKQNGLQSGISYATPDVTACCEYIILKTECDAEIAKEIVLNCVNKNEASYNYVSEG